MSKMKQQLSLSRRNIMRRRIFRRGWANLVRNHWLTLAATIVMSITLLIVFVTFMATLALSSTVSTIRQEKSDLSIFLKPIGLEDGTPEGVIDSLQTELAADPNVLAVKVAVEKPNDGNVQSVMESAGLKDEDVTLTRVSIKVNDVDDLDSVTKVVTDDLYMAYMDPDAYDSQFYNGDNTGIINKINSGARYVQIGGIGLGLVFLLISVLVIFNTIRMAIFARKDEIEMEKLIGAERKYIRGPFLVEAELYGVIAAGVAVTLGYLILLPLVPIMTKAGMSIALLTDVAYGAWPLVVIGLVLLGVLIGEVSARLAVRKYLHY